MTLEESIIIDCISQIRKNLLTLSDALQNKWNEEEERRRYQ